MKFWKQQFNSPIARKGIRNMRTLEAVHQEHNQTAYEIGVERYKIECANTLINELLTKMLALNEEGAAIMKETKENESKNQNNGANGTEDAQVSSGASEAGVKSDSQAKEAPQPEAAL